MNREDKKQTSQAARTKDATVDTDMEGRGLSSQFTTFT